MDPNTTLRDLRAAIEATRTIGHHPETVRQAAADAAEHAADLVDWLDRGGFLPNAWQPFNGATLGEQVMGAKQQLDDQAEQLAAFAKSLGDCNTDRCNMAIAMAKANRERDQAITARDKALSMARDEGHQASQRIDTLTRDLDHTREELVEAHEAAGLLASHLAATKQERDQLRADLAATLSTLEGRIEEEMAEPADRHQRDAWALLAREAASIAKTAADLYAGDHHSVKNAADLHNRHHGDDFAQLAAMLAVGAARYASRRKDADTAQRTADHLDQLADRIAPTTNSETTSEAADQ